MGLRDAQEDVDDLGAPDTDPLVKLERERQRALDKLELLDTARESEFDELVILASKLCSTPMSAVTLVDRNRQWHKAKWGIKHAESPRASSFCSLAIEQSGVFLVEDATLDERVFDNPNVLGEPYIRFYAGVPLFAPGHHAIGTLCVIDTKPRQLTTEQIASLSILARQVQARIDLRAKQRALEQALTLNQEFNAILVKNNNNLELVFDSVAAVLVGLDPEGCITLWNLAARVTFGLPQEEVLGKHLTSCGISWLESQARVSELWSADRLSKRGDYQVEVNGQKKWLDITISPVEKLGSRTRPGLLLSASDVTSRLALEQEVRQVHKLEAIGQLAAGIAHEINTPTQYIGDNLSFLSQSWACISQVIEISKELRKGMEQETSENRQGHAFDRAMEASDLDFILAEAPKALEQALDGVQAISRIVQAMKEFSHPGSQSKTVFDLNRAVENTVALGRSEWKYVADVVTQCDPSLPKISGHPGEIIQVILNLLVNAAHAIADKATENSSETRGTITILTRHVDQSVELLVTDNGSGIPESIREKIFDPFFTTKEVGRGTGQGLSFAHAVIVAKHGGKLWVESEVGQGSTFGVRLPVSARETEQDDDPTRFRKSANDGIARFRNDPAYDALITELDFIAQKSKHFHKKSSSLGDPS